MNDELNSLDRLLRCANKARSAGARVDAGMEQRVLTALRAEGRSAAAAEWMPVLRFGLGFAIACFVLAAALGRLEMQETRTAEDHGISLESTTFAWAK